MGRLVKTTETSVAVIANAPTTLTTIYTNTTGNGAELSSININGIADEKIINTRTGAGQWSFFGSSINPIVSASSTTGTGFGVPYSVQLSDNRLLLFFLPHFQHRGGTLDYMNGNTIHAQIVEHQTNKYVCGPIVNCPLPTAVYNSNTRSLWSYPSGMTGSYGPPNFQAVALSPTKVVAVYRNGSDFRLMRFTIIENTVSQTVENVNLTTSEFFNTTTAGCFDISIVPNNSNKIVVGGLANTNFAIQAINVPDTGPITPASSLTSTAIPVFTLMFTVKNMVKISTGGITPYIIAAATSATTGTAIIFNFNDALNTFTASGTPEILPAASTSWTGIKAACLSDGTDVNAVIGLTDSGNPTAIKFLRQISSAGASITVSTNLTLQHSAIKNISEVYQWGDERAVFVGDASLLVVYDSAGVATNLLPETETTNTTRIQTQWIPFNTRPLYNLYDPATILQERNINYLSRTDINSSTSVGKSTLTGNYFPFGHDYGDGYSWNEKTNCWIVGQGGRLYSISTEGIVIDEVQIYDHNTQLNYLYRVSQVSCTPSGRILYVCEYGTTINPSYNPWTQWNSLVNTLFCQVTEPWLDSQRLNQTTLQKTPFNTNGFLTCSLTNYVDKDNIEKAFLLYNSTIATPATRIVEFNGTTWSTSYNTSIGSTTAGAWNVGFRSYLRLIQDTPCSESYPQGQWRVLGALGTNSLSNVQRTGISIQYPPESFASFNTASFVLDNTSTNFGYGFNLMKYTSGSKAGITVSSIYDETLNTIRTFASVNGRLRNIRGYFLTSEASNNYRFSTPAVSKFAYAVAYQNTSFNQTTGQIYVWNNYNFKDPETILTTTAGTGTTVAIPLNKNEISIFGDEVDVVYTVSGMPETVKFFAAIDDNNGNTYFINKGQEFALDTPATSLYRSVDSYQIPIGYSLKVMSDTPNSLSLFATITEKI